MSRRLAEAGGVTVTKYCGFAGVPMVQITGETESHQPVWVTMSFYDFRLLLVQVLKRLMDLPEEEESQVSHLSAMLQGPIHRSVKDEEELREVIYDALKLVIADEDCHWSMDTIEDNGIRVLMPNGDRYDVRVRKVGAPAGALP